MDKHARWFATLMLILLALGAGAALVWAAPSGDEAPPIPHPTAGREDCLKCHGADGFVPYPQDHVGRTVESCTACHSAPQEEPTPTPEPGATPTPTPLPPNLAPVPTPIREPVMFGENTCISCHKDLGGEFARIVEDWSASARGVGCVSCHGGDPTQEAKDAAMSPEAGYLGPLPKEKIPGLCGSCHARVDLMRQFGLPTDQFSQYWESVHGKALVQGNRDVATCFDCHGGHRTLKVDDPSSDVYPTNEPAMCARCHADPEMMERYGLPTDVEAKYADSVHGRKVLVEQDQRAPTCSTCHGTHGAAPPGVTEVANVCGQCHALTEQRYLEGAHRVAMVAGREDAPRCVTCHGHHDVQPPTRDLYVGSQPGHCGQCHESGPVADQVASIYQLLQEADQAYAQAEATIAQAEEQRLIMAPQKEQLQRARSALVQVRALQHNVDVDAIRTKVQEAVEGSRAALESAQAALEDVRVRRVAMVIAVAVILLTILALWYIKRDLDRELEEQRARERGPSEAGRAGSA
ncbi:MAG: cytochrome c3 family protein [Anaerolineae bacterium]|nr:cytochrome c3 family protein [Anaerolineae bacterium]